MVEGGRVFFQRGGHVGVGGADDFFVVGVDASEVEGGDGEDGVC